MSQWTMTEIEGLLFQLEKRNAFFTGYRFKRNANGHVEVLGSGATGIVFTVLKGAKEYALKIIGFNNKHVESDYFKETIEAQRFADWSDEFVIKLLASKEIWIEFDESLNIIDITNKDNGNTNFLLQAILMEKLTPVFSRNPSGKIELCNELLQVGKETEIVKLAYDIGNALKMAHGQGILHRDLKLENVFYDPIKDSYKLGDFGVAKVTVDTGARTVAFTKGYGAPEVVACDDFKYDNTADIYSLGIMLYLLSNNMHFPDSDSYHVNMGMQYKNGYVLPKPGYISEELYSIIKRMCNFSPDGRYQNIEAVLQDLENLRYNEYVSENSILKEGKLRIALTLFLLSGILMINPLIKGVTVLSISVSFILLAVNFLMEFFILSVPKKDLLFSTYERRLLVKLFEIVFFAMIILPFLFSWYPLKPIAGIVGLIVTILMK